MTYTQLTREQRYQIYALMKAGLCQTKIAKVVGVHKSTISRERRGFLAPCPVPAGCEVVNSPTKYAT